MDNKYTKKVVNYKQVVEALRNNKLESITVENKTNGDKIMLLDFELENKESDLIFRVYNKKLGIDFKEVIDIGNYNFEQDKNEYEAFIDSGFYSFIFEYLKKAIKRMNEEFLDLINDKDLEYDTTYQSLQNGFDDVEKLRECGTNMKQGKMTKIVERQGK